jgi:hypothetical protein
MSAIALSAFALAMASPAAVPNDLTIVTLQRIGSYRYWPPASYQAAVTAFGRPSSKGTDVPDSNLCTVRWLPLGLDMGFASVPGACTAANLKRSVWFGATIHTRRWRTALGLRVGDSLTRLSRLYPTARLSKRLSVPPFDPTWSLVRRPDPDVGFRDHLTATVWAGRVTSISLPAGYIY